VFLTELRTVATDVGGWCDDPGPTNPLRGEGVPDVGWPAAGDVDAQRRRRVAGELVRAALHDPRPEAAEHRLRGEVDVLLQELHRERSGVRVVPLPRSLSVSQVQRLVADPADFARALARPLPRRPSSAARRGTRFHAWLEQTLGARPLFDTLDLDGSADTVVPDTELDELRAAFSASEFAERAPVAVEAPFAVRLGGRLVRGRIDAVFRWDGDGYEVVDWKTGERGDPLQLAIYRLAWAELAGVPIERVSAAFLHVASSRVVRPEGLPGRDELNVLVTTGSRRSAVGP
jgi:DNA helicase-2/ATP-dependent DNA helicase PcrA